MAPYMDNVKSHLCKDVFGEIELGLVVLEEKPPKLINIFYYISFIALECHVPDFEINTDVKRRNFCLQFIYVICFYLLLEMI